MEYVEFTLTKGTIGTLFKFSLELSPGSRKFFKLVVSQKVQFDPWKLETFRRFEQDTIDVLDFGRGVDDVSEVEQDTVNDLDLS